MLNFANNFRAVEKYPKFFSKLAEIYFLNLKFLYLNSTKSDFAIYSDERFKRFDENS